MIETEESPQNKYLDLIQLMSRGTLEILKMMFQLFGLLLKTRDKDLSIFPSSNFRQEKGK